MSGFEAVIGIVAVMAVLSLALAGVAVAAGRFGWSAEFTRKSLHVTLGLVCLTFPWLFRESWPVWTLAVLVTACLAALRLPWLKALVGKVLHTVARQSIGELLYLPSVALVFELANGRTEFFVIPVLILALADTAGALAGTRWGRSRYASGSGRKSIEGSAAFFLCAIACIAGPLLAAGTVPPDKVVWIALTLGLLATMLEGLADHGFDNLLLPLGGLLLLVRFVPMDTSALVMHCGIAFGLVALLAVCGRASTLDGGALLAAGLLGYWLVVLGGGWFLIPLFGLLGVHLATTWRYRLVAQLRHGVEAVAGVAIATVPWAAARPALGQTAALLGCSVAAAAMLALMHAGTRRFLGLPGLAPLAGLAKAAGATILPVMLVTRRWDALAPLASGLAMTTGAMFLFVLLRDRRNDDERGLWIIMGTLALACSAPCLMILNE